MGQTTTDLNERDVLVRIDCNQAEIRKLIAESDKFAVEQRKLAAAADEFRRDRFLAPLLATVAALGAIAALAPAILRSWGGH